MESQKRAEWLETNNNKEVGTEFDQDNINIFEDISS